MTINLPDDLRRFIDHLVAEGRYPSVEAAVIEAVAALRDEMEPEEPDLSGWDPAELAREIQKGVDAFEAGRYTECQTPQAMDALFEDIKRRGRERLQSSTRKKPHDSRPLQR